MRTYERSTGYPASPRATNSWLQGQIREARAHRVAAGVNAVGLLIASVGTYKRSLDSGDTKIQAGIRAFGTAAPGLALATVQGVANVARHIPLPLGLTGHIPGAEFVTRATGRLIMPALAAWSAHRGAIEDVNPLRGAARGLVRAVDPSSIVMGKGFAERGFDRVFGAAPDRSPKPILGPFGIPTGRSEPSPPNSYEQWIGDTAKRLQQFAPMRPDARRRWITGSAYLDPSAARGGRVEPVAVRGHRQAAPSYKDTWTDKRGRTYARHDTSMRKVA